MVLGYTSFGRNAWDFMDCFSLVVRTLRKITRQFNVPSGLCVCASYVGLADVCALVGLCELLTRSKLAIKSLIGGGYEPIWPAPYNTTATLKILKFSNFFFILLAVKMATISKNTL